MPADVFLTPAGLVMASVRQSSQGDRLRRLQLPIKAANHHLSLGWGIFLSQGGLNSAAFFFTDRLRAISQVECRRLRNTGVKVTMSVTLAVFP